MDRVMPFGKHKGKQFSAIPRGYLRWMIANVPVDGWLKNEIDHILYGSPLLARPLTHEEALDRILCEYDPDAAWVT